MLSMLLGGLVLIGLSLLAVPSILKISSVITQRFFMLSLFFSLFSIATYQITGNNLELTKWYAGGKKHYELQLEFERLGGIDIAIDRINKNLAMHPEDKKGWLILAKLYLAKNDKTKALYAFQKARGST